MSTKQLMLKRVKERAKKQKVSVELIADDITISTYCPILGIELHVNKGSIGR